MARRTIASEGGEKLKSRICFYIIFLLVALLTIGTVCRQQEISDNWKIIDYNQEKIARGLQQIDRDINNLLQKAEK